MISKYILGKLSAIISNSINVLREDKVKNSSEELYHLCYLLGAIENEQGILQDIIENKEEEPKAKAKAKAKAKKPKGNKK